MRAIEFTSNVQTFMDGVTIGTGCRNSTLAKPMANEEIWLGQLNYQKVNPRSPFK